MRILTFLILFSFSFGITDYDITNQHFTLNKINSFIKKFPNNKLTPEEIYHIYWTSNAWTIHPLVLLTIMEKETSLISNPLEMGKYKWRHHRACGYGLILATWNEKGKFYKYGGYYVQVHCATKAVRKYFDIWQRKKREILIINEGKNKIEINNVMDYICYKYTPYTHGKEDFDKIYNKFKSLW